MSLNSCRFVLVCVAVCLLLAPVVVGQDEKPEHELPESFSEPIPMYPKALGKFTRAISSPNAEAQAYFNQGMQLMYAFGKQYATRSFREAWKNDPDCAVCYWGEAWTWGSYLNGPMSEMEAPHAYTAIQKALELKQHASPKEADFIDAMAVRYIKDFDPEKRIDQDKAYAEAMRMLADKYPDDLDAVTLYGEALFLLEPRRGYRDINAPGIQKIHQIFEGVLEVDIEHPGACHLYIHSTESTVQPGKAEACAELLGNAIPGASHINHMPSHTFNEIGRWGDGVRANIQAWHSDLKSEIGEGVAIYPSHNLHMLLYAASNDGQGAIAMQAGRDYRRTTGNSIYESLTFVRFGRFDEILDEITTRPAADIPGGMWDFAQGYARLKNGEADFAAVYLERIKAAAASSEASFRRHPAKNLLGVVAGVLEGEMHREAGDPSAAIAPLEYAVILEDELDFDEPEALPFSARHWLGAALLDAGRWEAAEKVFRVELDDHPNNGWSLFGLLEALKGQGKDGTKVQEQFEAAWARSDTWIRGSVF